MRKLRRRSRKIPDAAPAASGGRSPREGAHAEIDRTDSSAIATCLACSIEDPTTIMRMPNRKSRQCRPSPCPGWNQRRAPSGAGSAGEYGAAPPDVTFHRMARKFRKGIRRRNGKRTRSDRDMRLRHPDDVEQQRRRQDRPTPAQQAQHEADESAGADRARSRVSCPSARDSGRQASSPRALKTTKSTDWMPLTEGAAQSDG